MKNSKSLYHGHRFPAGVIRCAVRWYYDNALAETINGLYKAKVIHGLGPWRNLQAVETGTIEWVDRFNHRRLLEPIGNVPPAEAEAAYYSKIARPAMGA
jgi:putative transposase